MKHRDSETIGLRGSWPCWKNELVKHRTINGTIQRSTTHNWKEIVSPTDAFTEGGSYVNPPFSPTAMVKVAAEAKEKWAAAARRTAENFMIDV